MSFDGTTVVARGDAASERILVDVDFEGNASIGGDVRAGSGCADAFGIVTCPLGPGGIVVQTGGGADSVRSLIVVPVAPRMLRVDLGDGNDVFEGQDAAEQADGGPGDDTLNGGGGDDELLGGDGNDTLGGQAGSDVLRGGAGDDLLSADLARDKGADVIDGGPGLDTADDWVPDGDPARAAPAAISLDGQADDGFAGEGDQVVDVERVIAGSALTYVGDDGANEAVAAEVGASSRLRGLGGADRLRGGDADDEIDGGAGDDDLQGGYGSDTITPGPGRDIVNADRAGRCNELHCDISPGLAADVILARDGEVDQIACGPGPDRVVADAVDVVAADCEQVERPAGAAAAQAAAAGAGPALGARARITVTRARLATALRRGLVLRVTGQAPRRRVRAAARLGRRVVARGTATAGTGGVAVVRLRFTAASRGLLARRAKVVLSVRAGRVTTRVVLRRARA